MSAREELDAKVDAYGVEQRAIGAELAAAQYEPVLASVRGMLADVTAERDSLRAQYDTHMATHDRPEDPNQPPTGYKVVTDTGADLAAMVLAGDKIALVGDGKVFRCDTFKVPVRGAAVWVGPGVTLLKTRTSGGGTKGAWFTNASWTLQAGGKPAPIQGLKVHGPGVLRDDGSGNVFGLWVHDFEVTGVNFTRWAGGRLFMTAGDRHRYHDFRARALPGTGGGTGGIRWAGGVNMRSWNLDVHSGDDVYQCVPAGDPSDPLFNIADSVDWEYRDCVGRSFTARLCIAGLQDKDDADNNALGMNVSIRDFRFVNISGIHGGSAVVVKQASSSGSLRNGVFENVTSKHQPEQAPDPTPGQPGHVFIHGVSGLGVIDNIDLSGITVEKSDKRAYFAQRGPASNIVKPLQA